MFEAHKASVVLFILLFIEIVLNYKETTIKISYSL